MAGYIIFNASIKDLEKLKAYSAQAGKLVAAAGGEFLAKGPATQVAGNSPHKMIVLIQFADKATAESFYHSAEYQALVPQRDEGLEADVFIAGE